MLRLRASALTLLCACALGVSLPACSSSSEEAGSSGQALEEFSPLAAEFDIPDNLGRPVTADDITVIKGYDGKTPEEAVKIIRANFDGKIDSSYESFIHERSLEVHKRWTMVIGNAFAENFPAKQFVETVASEGTHVFIVGTPRGEIFLQTTNPEEGEQWYLAKGNSFEPLAVAAGFKPFTPPVARAELRLSPPGIKVEYPKWKWAPLATPGKVEELPAGGDP